MTTAGFGGEGPVFVPAYDPELVTDERTDEERAAKEPVEEATPEEVEEQAAVVEHLDDPDVEEAIEKLRESKD